MRCGVGAALESTAPSPGSIQRRARRRMVPGSWLSAWSCGGQVCMARHSMARHSIAWHGTGSPSPRRGSQASPRSAGGRGCFSSALLSPQINYRARGDSSAPPGWPARRSIRPRAPPCPQSGCCAVGQPRRPVRNYAMARRTCSGRCFLLGIRRAERRVGTCVG